MKTVRIRLKGVQTVITHVRQLNVKVLYGKEMDKKLIISDTTVLVVLKVCELLSLVVTRIG